MPMAPQVGARVDVFDAAREELERMIAELREGHARSHTQVIVELREGGAEVQRRLLQGWLRRLLEEERAEVPSWAVPDGSEVRERGRSLETEFGRVSVRRHGITLPGEKEAKFPMDGALNLPPEIYALSLRRRAAEEAMGESFDAAVESIDRTTAGHVPKRQSEELVVRAACDFEGFYETRAPPANDTLSPRALQVMSADCKGVTMRIEALREATRKQGEADKADAVKGDPMAARKARRHDKRMAITAAVWEGESFDAAVESIDRTTAGHVPTTSAWPSPRPSGSRSGSGARPATS